jgi:hypothetical protein
LDVIFNVSYRPEAAINRHHLLPLRKCLAREHKNLILVYYLNIIVTCVGPSQNIRPPSSFTNIYFKFHFIVSESGTHLFRRVCLRPIRNKHVPDSREFADAAAIPTTPPTKKRPPILRWPFHFEKHFLLRFYILSGKIMF